MSRCHGRGEEERTMLWLGQQQEQRFAGTGAHTGCEARSCAVPAVRPGAMAEVEARLSDVQGLIYITS